MSDLKLFVLGAPYLEVGGHAAEIQRRKVLALLIYLAVTGQTQRRDTLATLLWPDAGQSQARAALGRHLSELRNLIGETHVTADRETIALAGDLWLDVGRFQQLIAGFDRNDPPSLDALVKAAALYRDDFLTGFTLPDCPDFDEWQFFQAEGLRQQFAVVLERLITALSDQGEAEAAIPHARRRLALDPLHEPAHRHLMQLYALTGQDAAALRQYQLCLQTLDDEFGAPPSAETTALYERILSGELRKGASVGSPPPPLPPAPPHNLPAQITPFIGREVELAELAALLGSNDGRLVTIVGPGGMGKTRLALAVAEAQLETDRFPRGIFFVSLAPLGDIEHIVPAIAEAIGHTVEAEKRVGQSAKAQLLNYLQARQLLLVLDNFEHLLAGVRLVADILQAAPQVHILVTSRERLHLHGEQLFPIRGLGFPDWETPGDAATYTAAQLFVQSARRVQPQFELAGDDLTALTRICRLVEGMPLGIELAAGWVNLLSLSEIVAEIQRSLDFLSTEARNVPDRQRSMRAVFDSSWQRMSEPEQQVFAQFSVFRGGFTRQAAEAVTGASLRLLSVLASKSLLQVEQAAGRYQIHELLRQYGAEKLEAAGQTEKVRDVHAGYFAGFLEQQEAALKGKGYRQAKAEIAADFENVRRAWLWAVERRDYSALAQAIEGLYQFLYQNLPYYQAGQELFQTGREALAPAEDEAPHPVWGKMLARILPYGAADFERPVQARVWLEQAHAIAEANGDEAEGAFCLWLLVQVKRRLGDLTLVKDELEQSLRYYRQVGDRFYMASTLEKLANIHNDLGQHHQAVAYHQQSLGLLRELGSSEVNLLFGLGLTLGIPLRDFEGAETQLRRAFQLSQAEGNPGDMAAALVFLSRVLSLKGDFEAAQTAALEALAIAGENNLVYRQLQARTDLGMRSYERGDFEGALTYLSQVQDRSTLEREQIWVELVLSLTMYALGKDQLQSYLIKRLRGPIALALYNLPVAGLLFKQAGLFERAASLLALFTSHDLRPWRGGFITLSEAFARSTNVTEFLRLKERLADALPPERFAAAWERGQQLDLAATLAALAEEFSQPD